MKFLKLLISSILLLGFSLAHAGKGYSVLNPVQPVQSGKKIEVLEFFSYGCSHCFDFQQQLDPWLKNLPKDVEFHYVPTVFDEPWVPLAKTYFALVTLGVEPKLHGAVYNAIHVQNINLSDEKTMLEWAAKQGLKNFSETYSSFSVDKQVKETKKMTKNYGIRGTPSVIVDGKYLTSPALTGSPQATITELDELIRIARSERQKSSH